MDMDRQKAIELLRSGNDGIKKWNEWRESASSGQSPDLSEADLSRADLREAYLGDADLSNANLCKANLSGADLRETSLREADLSDADLRGAKLFEAEFNDANLRGANLRGAKLATADLCGADLCGASLREAELSGNSLWGANLSEADLREADLSHAELSDVSLRAADLREADFTEAKLSNADLSGADLREAYLGDADLREADLSGADLSEADLSGANLRGAKLHEAHVEDTTWADVDLSEVNGLEAVQHHGPSTIGIDTLYKSHGKIPEAFLRGCGVPQVLIDYLPTLVAAVEPIQFCSCFISHSSKDKEFCHHLHDRMQGEGLRVWYNEDDAETGRKLQTQITQAIRAHDKLLIVLSEHSITTGWLKTELYQARQWELTEKRAILFPIRLCSIEAIRQWQCCDADSGKDLAQELRDHYIPGDFENWKDHDDFERAFAKLMENLRVSTAM